MTRPGAVIFVVLLAVVAMSAVLVTMLVSVRGQTDAIRASVSRSEQRLVHRSAAIALAAELYQEREGAMSGENAVLSTVQDVLRYESKQPWQWRLVGESGRSQAEPLAGRIDINHVAEEVLRSVLESHEIDSEHVAMHLPLQTPGMIRHVIGNDTDTQLAKLFTVTACDTQIQSGVGSLSANVGHDRVLIGSGEDPPSGLSPAGSALYSRISTGEWAPNSQRELLLILGLRAIDQDEWDVFLDLLDFNGGEPKFGLISLRHADAVVLAALPAVDDELAATLVNHRETLAAADLAGITWPVREGLMALEDYAEVVDMLCARSLQYSVEFSVSRESDDSEDSSEDDLSGRFQMVVDISGRSPRIAYLRDVSYLPWEVLPTQERDAQLVRDEQPSTSAFTQDGDEQAHEGDDVVRAQADGSFKWGRLGSAENR